MLFDNYQRFINNKLKEISSKDQFRQLKVSKRSKNSYVINDKVKLLSFACNDYLSLSTDKRLIEAAQKATIKFGTGSGASRLITGNNPLYNKLESNLREIKKTEACIVFGSGFLANLGVISALANKNDLILIDSLSHSSSFMGTKLTKAKVIKYKHNCIIDLEKKLIKYRKKYHKCMILTEGVFSMDGDISPQEEISYLKNKYNALFILDDAHGLGVLGDGTGSNTIFKNKAKFDEIPKSDLVLFTGLGHERYKRFPCFFPYERNKKSKAYIPRIKHDYKYVAGGILGGKTIAFLNLCHKIKNWIDDDQLHGIVPIFHDESYLNKYYFLNANKISLLNYIYCISEETARIKKIDAKIIFESKEKYSDKFIKRKPGISSNFLHIINKLKHAIKWF